MEYFRIALSEVPDFSKELIALFGNFYSTFSFYSGQTVIEYSACRVANYAQFNQTSIITSKL
jgi:hypothetical protein